MYQDRTLTCSDCGRPFVFTASEQQFFADRQFSEPRRCAACRANRKASRGDSAGGGFGTNGGGYGRPRMDRGPREMFTTTCSSCGREARVPFQPTSGKPVYCADCFATRR